jgi:hypothetical protein
MKKIKFDGAKYFLNCNFHKSVLKFRITFLVFFQLLRIFVAEIGYASSEHRRIYLFLTDVYCFLQKYFPLIFNISRFGTNKTRAAL